METGEQTDYTIPMVIVRASLPRRPYSDADRLAQIEREKAVIAKAEADIDAGLGIEDEDLEVWLDALDHDENAPLPCPLSIGSAAR